VQFQKGCQDTSRICGQCTTCGHEKSAKITRLKIKSHIDREKRLSKKHFKEAAI